MSKHIAKAVLILLAVLFILPVLISFISSLMEPNEVLYRIGALPHDIGRAEGLTMTPETVTLRQYYELLIENPMYLHMFWNSFLYASSITLLTNIIALPVAFAFAKVRFFARDKFFFLFIIVLLMPYQVTLLSNYILIARTGLLGSSLAVIIPSVFAPLGIFLLRQSIRSVPDTLIEAVVLETSSVTRILRHAIIPKIAPSLVTMNILVFADSWNMVEKYAIFINQPADMPLSVTLNGIMNNVPGISFAGSVLFMLPIIILYFMFEEQITKGLEDFRW